MVFDITKMVSGGFLSWHYLLLNRRSFFDKFLKGGNKKFENLLLNKYCMYQNDMLLCLGLVMLLCGSTKDYVPVWQKLFTAYFSFQLNLSYFDVFGLAYSL
mgnify:CR=1 FL=1